VFQFILVLLQKLPYFFTEALETIET
jgi:hypothetical protein